jgi:hypothetical protein
MHVLVFGVFADGFKSSKLVPNRKIDFDEKATKTARITAEVRRPRGLGTVRASLIASPNAKC